MSWVLDKFLDSVATQRLRVLVVLCDFQSNHLRVSHVPYIRYRPMEAIQKFPMHLMFLWAVLVTL